MLPEIPNSIDIIKAMQADKELKHLRRQWHAALAKYRYSYNFTWFGRPIIQIPDDIVVIQELILSIKPDIIIETGIAHGGSLVLSASMLQLLGRGKVVGVDIDIRPQNRVAIEQHPLSGRISLIEGSSINPDVVRQVSNYAKDSLMPMVILDSNHAHDHVLKELEFYSPLVRKGSYIVVFDTAIEDMPAGSFPNRPWDKGNNPKTAVREFLKSNNRFIIDNEIEDKLIMTVAPNGFLKCIKD